MTSATNPATTAPSDDLDYEYSESLSAPKTDDDDDESMDMILDSQPYLYDLHTHLLGMGNTGFWIDSIIEKQQILPTHTEFCYRPKLREQLCPLIWDRQAGKNGAFIDGKRTAMFFDYLIEKNFPQSDVAVILGCLSNVQYTEIIEFYRLIANSEFLRQLEHYHLFFGQSNKPDKTRSNDGVYPIKHTITGDFTYDTVLTLSDLSKALGITIPWVNEFEDLIQSKVEEKLGLHTYQQSTEPSDRSFRRWIIFNAREQVFEIVKGIKIETLRKFIAIEANAPEQKCTLARAHIQNAFSMRNPDGTDPRPIDFDRFHGSFTPEFYPRRFALKDSLYSQRLDVLAALLVYVLRRYQTCLPPIRYCELSVGVGDISRPWVLDVLCSFPAYERFMNDTQSMPPPTSFRTIIQTGHFLHLRNACPKLSDAEKKKLNETDEKKPYDTNELKLSCIPNVMYKFLAGFSRQAVVEHRIETQLEAFRLLNDSPDVAIHYMLEQIARSEEEEDLHRKGKSSQASTGKPHDKLFSKALDDLEKLKQAASKNQSFYYWVVGLDLFGDELGYPYCPFVAWRFIEYIRECRVKNEKFGLRIHCGENVAFTDIDAGAYRHFIAHMYIVFRCLRFLQRKLKNGIRIGHGVAFARILGDQMIKSTHRKSSVLLAEMQDHARHLFTKIVFEINITSNEYLLGQALRAGDHQQIIRLDSLANLDIPIILATDDDGIWPIDYCLSKHPGHKSLVAEYCRAFSLKLITTPSDLRKMLVNTRDACFYSCNGIYTPLYVNIEDGILPKDDRYASTIVFHPDLIKTLLGKYYAKEREKTAIYQYYDKLYPLNRRAPSINDSSWNGICESLARFVFLSYYIKESSAPVDHYNEEYKAIFGDNIPLTTINEFWVNVWARFMYPSDMTRGNHIGTGSGPVFVSESSHHETQNLPYLIDRLNDNHFIQRDIRVFTRQVSKPKEMIENLNKYFRQQFSPKSITVITTKNKDLYTDSVGTEERRVVINKNPTQRTNCYGIQEQHVLYVICRHASAATAYLHYIGREIEKNNQQAPANLHTQQSITTVAQGTTADESTVPSSHNSPEQVGFGTESM